MYLYHSETFADSYSEVLYDLIEHPEYSTMPRGIKINEIINTSIVINNPKYCLYNNARRSSQYSYIAAELVWYLSGDNTLPFIEKHAKFWNQITNPDGTLNSAYGYLLFKRKNQFGKTQWQWAYESLIQDKDTRQAIMHFNTPDHQFDGNKDFVCTLSGIFHIRDNKLDFTVTMRSNDAILGLPTDIAFFCLLQQQMLKLLKEDKYPELELGKYTHIDHSLHIYERNFDLVKEMNKQSCEKESFPEIGVNLIDKEGNMSIDMMYLNECVRVGFIFESTDPLLNWIYNNIKK